MGDFGLKDIINFMGFANYSINKMMKLELENHTVGPNQAWEERSLGHAQTGLLSSTLTKDEVNVDPLYLVNGVYYNLFET